MSKLGTGTLTLSGNNTAYTGNTSISAGTLKSADSNIFKNNVNVSTGATAEIASSTNATHSANFSGDGSVNINPSNNSTITLTGSSTHTGGTTVSAGTLKVGSAANLGSGQVTLNNGTSLEWSGAATASNNVNLASGSATVNTESNNVTFQGAFSGSGTIIKAGAGRLTIDTANSSGFSGQTQVNGGELKLNTTLGGDMTVDGGMLTGTGTVGGNLVVDNGSLAPGNSIGTINVGGNFTQNSGTTYYVQLDETGASTKTNITGTATIASNTTLDVTSNTGYFNIHQPYTIMTAQGGITGIYDNITTHNLVLVPSLWVDGDDMLLSFQRNFLNVASKDNEWHVAYQLETINNPTPTAAQSELLNELTSINTASIRRAMHQLSGEQYTHLLITREQDTNRFMRQLYSSLRSRATSVANKADGKCHEPRFWVLTSAQRSFYKDNRCAEGFRTSGVTLSLGAENSLNCNWTAGGSLSYSRAHLSDHLNGANQQQTGLAGLYAIYRPADFYVLGNIVVGYSETKVRRSVYAGALKYVARSKPTAMQTGIYAEVGKDYVYNGLLIQPFAGLQGGYYLQNASKEKGAGVVNLEVLDNSYLTASSRLGVHLTKAIQAIAGLQLGLDLAWQHRLSSAQNTTRVRFQDFGGAFKVEGVGYTRDSMDAALSVSKQLSNIWQGTIQANTELGGYSTNYGFALELSARI